MKEFLNLLKQEFKKNLNFKKVIIIFLIIIASSFITKSIYELFNPQDEISFNNITDASIYNANEVYNNALKKYQEDNNYDNLIIVEHAENLKKIEDNYHDFGKKYLYRRDLINEYITNSFELMNLKKEHANNTLINEKESDLKELEHLIYNSKLYDFRDYYVPKYKEEIKVLKEKLKTNIEGKEKIKSKIYNLERKIDLLEIIMDKKIEDTLDYRGEMALLFLNFSFVSMEEMLMEESEFKVDSYTISQYETYEKYKRVIEKEVEKHNNFLEYLYYGVENDIYPQINKIKIEGYTNNLTTTKDIFDNIYYLGIVSLVITMAFFGNILIKEHKSGTYKMLAINSKRSNIILSKFMFLVIILFSIYLVSFIIHLLTSIFSYGFDDLMIPHLEIINNKVVESNYLIYVFKNVLKHTFILIIYLAIIILISSLIFKQSISSSVTMIILIIMLFIKNTNYFIPLFSTNYKYLDVSNMVILSAIIYIILLLSLSVFIYKNKDLKN